MVAKYNIAISLLKIAACISVVYCHFGGGTISHAVPIFMIIAFLHTKIGAGVSEGVKRLSRLLPPFWFWGVMGLCVWPITTMNEWDWAGLGCRFIAQMIFGCPLNSPLYFIFVLIVLTCLLFGVGYDFSFKGRFVFVVIATLAFVVQYSGFNYDLCRMIPTGAYVVFGRILELLPYAVVGVLIGDLRRMNSPRLIILIGVFMLALALAIRSSCSYLTIMPKGFGYQGVLLFMECVGCVSVFVGIGDVLPLATEHSSVVFLSLLTPGIYYSHRLLGDLLNLVCPMRLGLINVLAVWLLSLFICYIMRQNSLLKKYVA